MGRLSRAAPAALAAALGLSPGPAAAAFDSYPQVRLRLLDKVTARTSTVNVPVGETYRFATLRITAWTCRQRPPEERPESAAFLEIAEKSDPAAAGERVYSGWMFASSPAVAALEHPVYDVWVLRCAGEPLPLAGRPRHPRRLRRGAQPDSR